MDAVGLVAFRTASGSRYEIDNHNLTWRRTAASLASGRLRSESGRLVRAVRPVLGSSAVLVSEPLAPSLGYRVVVTTPVVALEPVPAVAMRTLNGARDGHDDGEAGRR